MPSKSVNQQRFFGLVRAVQKGEKNPKTVSKKVRDAAKDMSKQDVKDFAATPHEGLPKKVAAELARRFADM